MTLYIRVPPVKFSRQGINKKFPLLSLSHDKFSINLLEHEADLDRFLSETPHFSGTLCMSHFESKGLMIMLMMMGHLGLLAKKSFWDRTIWLYLPFPVTNMAVSISPLQGVEIISSPIALLCILQEDIAFDAVSVGAILSDYQRVRVENV